MSEPMTDERFEELGTGYVLDLLDDAERSEFLRELDRRGDEGLRTLARVEEVVGHVGLAAPPVQPPPELRRRVMADLGIERPSDTLPPAGHQPSRPSGGRRGFWMAAAAVLFVAAGGLGYWALRLDARLERREAALAEARTELATLDSLRARLDAARTDFRALASPAMEALSLSGTESLPGASARIYVDPTTGRALILADELPILPPDSVYQLWAIRGQTPSSVGTFQMEDPGPARIAVPDPSVLRQAEALAVTVEPAPGQPQPTGDIVLSSSP